MEKARRQQPSAAFQKELKLASNACKAPKKFSHYLGTQWLDLSLHQEICLRVFAEVKGMAAD